MRQVAFLTGIMVLVGIFIGCSPNDANASQKVVYFPVMRKEATEAGTPTTTQMLTQTPSPTATSAPSPTPTHTGDGDGEIKYYWLPAQFHGAQIDACYSQADETGFYLSVRSADAQSYSMAIGGGSGVHWRSYLPPCEGEYLAVTVRGYPGCAHEDSNRHTSRIFWQEGNIDYAVSSQRATLEDTLAAIETLEIVSLAVFQQHLVPLITPTSTPSGPLVYYWPTVFPKELIINPEKSVADETGFVLSLICPGSGWSATIWGGSESSFNESCDRLYYPGIVRGEPGYINDGTGAGFGVAWRKNGHSYVVGGPGMSYVEVQELTTGLEPVDLAEWRRRLEQLR